MDYHGVSKELKNQNKLSVLTIEQNKFYYSESVKQQEVSEKFNEYFDKASDFWSNIKSTIQ